MKTFDLRKVIRPLGFLVVVVIAILCIKHVWDYYNAEPWTRDGRVRGDVIQVFSDIRRFGDRSHGADNQTVKKKGRSYLKLILHGKL